MKVFYALRGATAYEAQIGKLWVRWPYWQFMRLGCWPVIGWERDE